MADRDARLGELLSRNGLPPLRLRPEGFATLVHLILQQQVSRASAQAVFDRLVAAFGGRLDEPALLAMAPAELRRVGLSGQKTDFVRTLAANLLAGEFDLLAIAELDDDDAMSALVGQRGIGPWTASVYVLVALGRPDVWAVGDRALLVSMGRMLGRPAVPDDEATRIAQQWRPWRAVAARILWHDYAVVSGNVAP